MQRVPLDDPPTNVPRSAGVERAAWAFYVIAAAGSSIGQIWVGVEVPPWPATVPLWVRVLLVMPFAIVIDLGGAVASAFADARRRLGETAYGWRLLSAASVALAVGINIVGHAGSPYLATVFAGLGIFAYSVWLLHTSARRRDALRATGMLRHAAPSYGLLQWKTAPAITWRARALAIDRGYGLTQSLTIAREQLAAEKRSAALATHIEAKIRARHEHDPNLASIAATTTPVDEVAQALIDMIDARGWATLINAEIQPPRPATTPAAVVLQPSGAEDTDDGDGSGPSKHAEDLGVAEHRSVDDGPTELARMMPTSRAVLERWQGIWAEISDRPNATNKQLADDFATSVRTVQRIRAVGATGLLGLPAYEPRRSGRR